MTRFWRGDRGSSSVDYDPCWSHTSSPLVIICCLFLQQDNVECLIILDNHISVSCQRSVRIMRPCESAPHAFSECCADRSRWRPPFFFRPFSTFWWDLQQCGPWFWKEDNYSPGQELTPFPPPWLESPGALTELRRCILGHVYRLKDVKVADVSTLMRTAAKKKIKVKSG